MLPIYEIKLGDCEGVTKMSLVSSPAVESNFIAFAKDEPMQFSIDEEQHNVFGVALRADYPIYRRSERLGEYYVVFTKDVIRQLYDKFMKNYGDKGVNLEHSKDTTGVYMVQSFLKSTAAGIVPKGFDDIAEGSWFVMYHIDNPEVWLQVKSGVFNGFSVECVVDLSEQPVGIEAQSQKDELEELINKILENE